ncbi:hypothetical protein Ac2012v2_007539 [Leucoagaricus gongylophorus]
MDDLALPSTADKGKRRADASTERTPLLQNGSTSRDTSHVTTPPSSTRSVRSILTTVFLVSLSICSVFAVISVLLAWSYASRISTLVPEQVINQDVVLSGPFQVDVLNTTDYGGLWLNVSGRMGFDAGDAMGFNHPLPGESEGLFGRVWKALGRWGIRTLDTVTVDLATVHIAPEYDEFLTLLEVKLPPTELPLTVDPSPRSDEWLTPLVSEVLVQPKNVTAVVDFLSQSWKAGSLNATIRLAQLRIIGGGSQSSWKTSLHGKMTNVQTSIRLKIPLLPGIPQPGGSAPLPSVSDFLTFKTIQISSEHNLTLYSEADVINPCPESFNFSIPSLPFTISLPNSFNSPLPVASVITHPFVSTHPNITIQASGIISTLPQSSFRLLSTFFSRFLSGKPNQILISTPLFSTTNSSGIQVPAEFPAPSHRPNILRNVTIKDMSVRPSGTTFVASGIVFAKVVLPKGINVGLEVFRVFPDVLVFDGEAPEEVSPLKLDMYDTIKKRTPPQMPSLPDPLPPRAFGHIRPDDWLQSTSVRLASVRDGLGDDDNSDSEGTEETGAVYAVSAKVVDVPLQMLPGRQKEFSDFVGKVIFGSAGAIAGIKGYAAVAVGVDGLPLDAGDTYKESSEKGVTLELTGLPIHGNVRIGKK